MGRLLSTANLPILVNTNTTPAILRGQERFLGYVPFRFCLGYVAILWAWKDPLTMKIFMKPNFRYFEGFFCLVKEPFSYNTEHFTSIFGTNRKLQTWIIFICIPYQISIQQALLYGSWLVTRPLSDYAHSIGFFGFKLMAQFSPLLTWRDIATNPGPNNEQLLRCLSFNAQSIWSNWIDTSILFSNLLTVITTKTYFLTWLMNQP